MTVRRTEDSADQESKLGKNKTTTSISTLANALLMSLANIMQGSHPMYAAAATL